MFGILLAGLSSAFDEVANSIGKKRVSDGAESYYTFGFLTQFVSCLLILASGVFLHSLVFSSASLPTFIPRALVAILEIQLAVIATVKADRGNFGFIKLATIPLLLLFDLVLGYSLSLYQIGGMFLILLPIGILFGIEKFKTKGFWLVLSVAVLAAIDLSLYKYDISNFNSVAGEQGVISLILSVYFFLASILLRRENPLIFLKQPIYLAQAGASGAAYVVNSFAYLFAPASVIVAAFRGFSVLFSILTGTFYFKEKRFAFRVTLFGIIVAGLLLLIL